MIYTHVLKLGGGAVRSPIDSLPRLLREPQPLYRLQHQHQQRRQPLPALLH